MTDFGKVAVLSGGASAEREISLLSGARVLDALRRQGIDARAFDPAERRLDEIRAFDRVFIALHGRHGEDGTIQGMLELMGIPYTGSGVMASAIGMDKWRTKLLWRSIGLPVPDFAMLDSRSDFDAIESRLGLPLFVKPVSEGSSIGVSKVCRPGRLRDAWVEAARHDSPVIAERGILDGEYTVAILGDEALPVVRIVPATNFYDYEAKYLRDDTRYLCPCGLSGTRERELRAQSLEAFRVLGCRGWGRVDFLMDERGGAYFLEVNTSPGMTDHSLVPMAARAAGISYEQLVARVLALAALG
ncbi:MAG: D-alanine--D-alanine ligase [Candidatus Accumulibacter sp.]|jgi:D-alanine-D-alanine ligase|nr:D-alanine--D-alanine ligase [Accumulibacter sp.]